VVAADEAGLPRPVGEQAGAGVAGLEHERPGGAVGHGGGIGEDRPHAGVGGEPRALPDADRSEQAAGLGVDDPGRFPLDDGGEFVIEPGVVGMDRVEDPARHGDELGRRRCAGSRKGIDAEAFAEAFAGAVGLPVDEQPAHDQPVGVRRRLGHEVVVGDRTGVPRRHDEVPAALAAIRARAAHVDDEPEPGIVDRPRSAPRGDLHHRRSVAVEIEERRGVDRVGVAGEEQRMRIEQVVGDADLMADDGADPGHAPPHRLQGCRGHAVEEPLHAAHEVEVVIEPSCRLGGGEPVGELEGPDPAVDPFRRHDRRRDGGVEPRRNGCVRHLRCPFATGLPTYRQYPPRPCPVTGPGGRSAPRGRSGPPTPRRDG